MRHYCTASIPEGPAEPWIWTAVECIMPPSIFSNTTVYDSTVSVKFDGRALGLAGWAGGCFQRYFTDWLAFNHVVNCKVEHLGGVWVHGLVTACEVQHEPYPQTLGRQRLLPALLVGCGALLSVWGADWEFYPLTWGHLSMHIAWPLALDMALGFCSSSAGIVIVAFRVISSVVALRVGGDVSLFSD